MEAAVVKRVETSPVMPLLIPASGVAQLLSVSTRQVWNMHATGMLGPLPIRLGGRTLWRAAELQAWVESGCPRREQWLDGQKVRRNLR